MYLLNKPWYSGCFPLLQMGIEACGGVAFFILLDIVDEPMNGSSYAQCATPQYLKTVQFSSVNLEPLAQTWFSSPVA
jgi:hypothetical protein